MRLKGLRVALRAGKVKHTAVDGWKTRGSFTFIKLRGILLHHTASSRKAGDCPATNTLVWGRPDLPGPLCHIQTCRDGSVKVIAAGKANHAGYGGPFGKWSPANMGNYYMLGIESENNGVGEPWSEEHLDAIADVCAAVLWHYRRGMCKRSPRKAASKVRAHREWTTRKIDPTYDMDDMRKRVERRIRKKVLRATK